MTKEELFARAEAPFDFRTNYYLNEGFAIFKKNIGGFIGMMLLTVLMYIVLGLIPFLGGIASSLLGILFSAGVIIVVKKIRNGENVQFNDFFSAFNNAGPAIVVSFMQGLIIMLSAIPALVVFFVVFFAQISSGGTPDSSTMFMMIPLFLLLLIPTIFLTMCYMFSMHIVLFVNQDFWTAMEASRKLVMKNWMSALGFVLSLGILSILVILLTCGIGYIVMAPVATAAMYLAFEDAFKPTLSTFENKIESFGQAQSDINTESDERNG